MSQARLPRTEPSTELITAHKGNNCDAHAALQTRDFSALPKHRECKPFRTLSIYTTSEIVRRWILGTSTARDTGRAPVVGTWS